jgi:hypothetical protein
MKKFNPNTKQSHIILDNIGVIQGHRSFYRVVKTASNGQQYVDYCGGRYIVEKFKGIDGTIFNFYVGIETVCLILNENDKWVFEIN